MKLLITGLAGFIGHAVAKRLSGRGHEIVGIDNLNDYYDVSLKRAQCDFQPMQPGYRPRVGVEEGVRPS